MRNTIFARRPLLLRELTSTSCFVLWGLALGGCSFLLDFPKEGTTSAGGGTGGAGHGGAGGAGGGSAICAQYAAAPTVDKPSWRSKMNGPGTVGGVATTGLVRVGAQLFAYGRTTDGLTSFFTGSGTHVGELYLTKIPDMGAPSLAFAATACNGTRDALSGKITSQSDGRVAISGSLGFDLTLPGPGTWSFALGDADVCSSGATTVNAVNPYDEFNGSPFFAVIGDTSIDTGLPPMADGIGLDIDDNKKNYGAIGIATGQVFEKMGPDLNERFFVQRSTETSANTTFVLANHFLETHIGFAYGEAAVAVDDAGNAWFGGGSCNDIGSCAGQGAFFGVLPATGSPELIVEQPGTPSAITSMAFVDSVLVLGGRYDGSLAMLGETLPASSGGDAFVMAVDPVTRKVIWRYPAGDAKPAYDPTGFNTVVDVAALGTRVCGAVYVLGCTVPTGGTAADCSVPAKGKRGFLLKLDLGNGKLVSVDDFTLENPSVDFAMPTALTASGEKIWMAATISGKATIAGTPVVGGAPEETVVLQLSH